MAVRNGPLAAAGSNDGYVRGFGQLDEGLLRIGARHPASGVYQGYARPGNDLGGFPEVYGAGHNPGDAGGFPQRDLLTLHPGLGRHLYQNGTGAAGAQLSERLEHGVRHFPGPRGLPLPLGHGAHRARLVGDS